jgi:hypothetical protein
MPKPKQPSQPTSSSSPPPVSAAPKQTPAASALSKPAPGILKMSLGGVTLYQRGESLKPGELEARITQGLAQLPPE